MIAFNFNIHFQDEPSLDDGVYDSSKDDITVVKSSDSDAFDSLQTQTAYLSLSGRKVKYCAEKVYEDCQEGCRWGLDIKDVAYIMWQCGKHTIEYIPQKEFTPELLQFWILHTVLPLVLNLEKRYDILHVGSVEINGRPVLFSAESFGGKSTMTDYFIKQGHTMLSDDSVGIYKENGTYMVVPSYPFHRPYRELETLGQKVTNVTTKPKPLYAVYLLDKAEADSVVKIEELKGIEKFKAFHFSTFINFDFLKPHRFKLMSDMAVNISVYKVAVPWELTRLNEVYAAIIDHKSDSH